MRNFSDEIITAIYMIIMAIGILGIITFEIISIKCTEKMISRADYIQNLEEKVNILTVDYENYALEDSLRQ